MLTEEILQAKLALLKAREKREQHVVALIQDLRKALDRLFDALPPRFPPK